MLNESHQNMRVCVLCERKVNTVSLHHLVPKQEGGKYQQTVPLCQPCHSTIHLHFTNKELANNFYTIPSLQEAPRLIKYLNWIRKRNIEKISNRRA